MVLPRFIKNAMQGEPIVVYGDGQQTRCFSSVHDVVRGTLLLAGEPGAEGEVFNIGTDEEVSILDLAQRVKRVTGSDSTIEFVPFEQIYGSRFEDMQRRVPDLTKIRALVGYEPQWSLDRLLETTAEDYRRQPVGRVAAPAATNGRHVTTSVS
jgi:UDP-glucose 4-epimerase